MLEEHLENNDFFPLYACSDPINISPLSVVICILKQMHMFNPCILALALTSLQLMGLQLPSIMHCLGIPIVARLLQLN